MFNKPEEVLEFIKNEDVKFVDIRFCDLPGVMQHFNVPAGTVDADFFTNGQAFDGSSIRGFQAIHESDMKLIPDIATAYLDPFRAEKTLIINFSIVDPFTDEAYSRDPRNIAAKAEAYLKSTGIADTAYFGAGGGVLHLRRRPLRDQGERRLLLHRLDRGGLEHRSRRGRRQPRLQDALQGRLLPRPAGRPLRRHPRRDLPAPGRGRPERRALAPRGRHRGPAGDQLPVQHPAAGRATT